MGPYKWRKNVKIDILWPYLVSKGVQFELSNLKFFVEFHYSILDDITTSARTLDRADITVVGETPFFSAVAVLAPFVCMNNFTTTIVTIIANKHLSALSQGLVLWLTINGYYQMCAT